VLSFALSLTARPVDPRTYRTAGHSIGAFREAGEFQVCCAILDDYRKLIASGKVQRWEFLKWAVTVNLGLATASIALNSETKTVWISGWILVLSIFVAVIGALLVLYYNDRITNARNASVEMGRNLMENGVNVAAIAGKKPERFGFWYDLEELVVFLVILGLSVVPALIVWWVVRASAT